MRDWYISKVDQVVTLLENQMLDRGSILNKLVTAFLVIVVVSLVWLFIYKIFGGS